MYMLNELTRRPAGITQHIIAFTTYGVTDCFGNSAGFFRIKRLNSSMSYRTKTAVSRTVLRFRFS